MRVQLSFTMFRSDHLSPVSKQLKQLDTQTLCPGLTISLAVPISVHEEEHGDYIDLNRYGENYTLTFKATENVLVVEIVYRLPRVVLQGR